MIDQKPTVFQILETVRELTPQEQLELLQGITALLRGALPATPTHSVLELEGLGANVWQGVDAQAYVNHERATWTG